MNFRRGNNFGNLRALLARFAGLAGFAGLALARGCGFDSVVAGFAAWVSTIFTTIATAALVAVLTFACGFVGFFARFLAIAFAPLRVVAIAIVAARFIAFAPFAALLVAATAVAVLASGRGGGFRFRRGTFEPGENARQNAGGGSVYRRLNNRRLHIGHDILDGGFLTRAGGFSLTVFHCLVFAGKFYPLVGRVAQFFAIQFIVFQTADVVRRGFQMNIGNQQNGNLVAQFDGLDVLTFFVQQERGDIDRHLHMHGGGVVLHRFFFKDTQDVQGGGFGGANMPCAGTARAGDVAGFSQRRTQALAGKFHQTEAADFAHLHARAIEFQRVFQAGFHFALIFRRFHVDEVDNNQTAQVTQAQLAGDFFGSFEIGFERRFFNVRAARGATGVYVDRDQRFGMVDDDGAAGGQIDLTTKGGFDLMFNLEAGEQRHVVVVTLDAVHVARHHLRHEGLRLFKNLVGVD